MVLSSYIFTQLRLHEISFSPTLARAFCLYQYGSPDTLPTEENLFLDNFFPQFLEMRVVA